MQTQTKIFFALGTVVVLVLSVVVIVLHSAPSADTLALLPPKQTSDQTQAAVKIAEFGATKNGTASADMEWDPVHQRTKLEVTASSLPKLQAKQAFAVYLVGTKASLLQKTFVGRISNTAVSGNTASFALAGTGSSPWFEASGLEIVLQTFGATTTEKVLLAGTFR
jgi:hypothetical protein